MKYEIRGYDEYGNLKTETFEWSPPTRWQRLKLFLARKVGWKWAYRLGLSSWRPISGITVHDPD